jgi:hypothetical protein
MHTSSKRQLIFFACVTALGLAACHTQPASDSDSDFYPNVVFQGGVSGYAPTGWKWVPSDKVEISIWNEPDGPGSTSTQWKKILDEHVDANTMFGFQSGAPFYPVRRSLCGNPVDKQVVFFMAKSTTTGRIQIRTQPADLYYTFQPCR